MSDSQSKRYDTLKTPIQNMFGDDSYIASCIIGIILAAIFIILSFINGDELIQILPAAIFSALSIVILMIGEIFISGSIRKRLGYFWEVFDKKKNADDYLRRMNMIERIYLGIIFACGFFFFDIWFGPIYYFIPLLWFRKLVVLIFGFLVGELILGVYYVEKEISSIGEEIKDDIDVIDVKKNDALEKLVGIYVLIFVFMGLLVTLMILGSTFAPALFSRVPSILVEGFIIGLAFPFTLFILVYPTYRIHIYMVCKKSSKKETISSFLVTIFAQIDKIRKSSDTQSDDNSDESMDYDKLSKEIAIISKLDELVQKSPEWPFDTSQVRQLAGAGIAPLLIEQLISNWNLIVALFG